LEQHCSTHARQNEDLKPIQAFRGAVVMNESLIINDIYDASSSDSDWFSLGEELFEYLGADAGTLRFKSADGRSANVFQPCDAGSDPYTNYYLHIDPIRSAIAEMRCDPKRGEAVVSVDEVVNEDLYRGSELASPVN
jgi:hypothetical protein